MQRRHQLRSNDSNFLDVLGFSRWLQLKYFLFSPRTLGKRWSPIWLVHIFQMGWFKNHQLVVFFFAFGQLEVGLGCSTLALTFAPYGPHTPNLGATSEGLKFSGLVWSHPFRWHGRDIPCSNYPWRRLNLPFFFFAYRHIVWHSCQKCCYSCQTVGHLKEHPNPNWFKQKKLVGGFNSFLFSSVPGEIIHFD